MKITCATVLDYLKRKFLDPSAQDGACGGQIKVPGDVQNAPTLCIAQGLKHLNKSLTKLQTHTKGPSSCNELIINGRALHYVIRVDDKNASLKFYTDVMGMKILRNEEVTIKECKTDQPCQSKTIVGYGPEDSYFCLQLIYDSKKSVKQSEENECVGLTVIASQALEQAKRLNWPIHSYNMLQAPDGLKLYVIDSPSPRKSDPIIKISLACTNLTCSLNFWHSMLGLTLFQHCKIEKRAQVSFRSDEIQIELRQVDVAVNRGQSIDRIVFSCPIEQLQELQNRVSREFEGRVVFPLSKQEYNDLEFIVLADPDGHEVCFVDDYRFREISRPDSEVRKELGEKFFTGALINQEMIKSCLKTSYRSGIPIAVPGYCTQKIINYSNNDNNRTPDRELSSAPSSHDSFYSLVDGSSKKKSEDNLKFSPASSTTASTISNKSEKSKSETKKDKRKEKEIGDKKVTKSNKDVSDFNKSQPKQVNQEENLICSDEFPKIKFQNTQDLKPCSNENALVENIILNYLKGRDMTCSNVAKVDTISIKSDNNSTSPQSNLYETETLQPDTSSFKHYLVDPKIPQTSSELQSSLIEDRLINKLGISPPLPLLPQLNKFDQNIMLVNAGQTDEIRVNLFEVTNDESPKTVDVELNAIKPGLKLSSPMKIEHSISTKEPLMNQTNLSGSHPSGQKTVQFAPSIEEVTSIQSTSSTSQHVGSIQQIPSSLEYVSSDIIPTQSIPLTYQISPSNSQPVTPVQFSSSIQGKQISAPEFSSLLRSPSEILSNHLPPMSQMAENVSSVQFSSSIQEQTVSTEDSILLTKPSNCQLSYAQEISSVKQKIPSEELTRSSQQCISSQFIPSLRQHSSLVQPDLSTRDISPSVQKFSVQSNPILVNKDKKITSGKLHEKDSKKTEKESKSCAKLPGMREKKSIFLCPRKSQSQTPSDVLPTESQSLTQQPIVYTPHPSYSLSNNPSYYDLQMQQHIPSTFGNNVSYVVQCSAKYHLPQSGKVLPDLNEECCQKPSVNPSKQFNIQSPKGYVERNQAKVVKMEGGCNNNKKGMLKKPKESPTRITATSNEDKEEHICQSPRIGESTLYSRKCTGKFKRGNVKITSPKNEDDKQKSKEEKNLNKEIERLRENERKQIEKRKELEKQQKKLESQIMKMKKEKIKLEQEKLKEAGDEKKVQSGKLLKQESQNIEVYKEKECEIEKEVWRKERERIEKEVEREKERMEKARGKFSLQLDNELVQGTKKPGAISSHEHPIRKESFIGLKVSNPHSKIEISKEGDSELKKKVSYKTVTKLLENAAKILERTPLEATCSSEPTCNRNFNHTEKYEVSKLIKGMSRSQKKQIQSIRRQVKTTCKKANGPSKPSKIVVSATRLKKRGDLSSSSSSIHTSGRSQLVKQLRKISESISERPSWRSSIHSQHFLHLNKPTRIPLLNRDKLRAHNMKSNPIEMVCSDIIDETVKSMSTTNVFRRARSGVVKRNKTRGDFEKSATQIIEEAMDIEAYKYNKLKETEYLTKVDAEVDVAEEIIFPKKTDQVTNTVEDQFVKEALSKILINEATQNDRPASVDKGIQEEIEEGKTHEKSSIDNTPHESKDFTEDGEEDIEKFMERIKKKGQMKKTESKATREDIEKKIIHEAMARVTSYKELDIFRNISKIMANKLTLANLHKQLLVKKSSFRKSKQNIDLKPHESNVLEIESKGIQELQNRLHHLEKLLPATKDRKYSLKESKKTTTFSTVVPQRVTNKHRSKELRSLSFQTYEKLRFPTNYRKYCEQVENAIKESMCSKNPPPRKPPRRLSPEERIQKFLERRREEVKRSASLSPPTTPRTLSEKNPGTTLDTKLEMLESNVKTSRINDTERMKGTVKKTPTKTAKKTYIKASSSNTSWTLTTSNTNEDDLNIKCPDIELSRMSMGVMTDEKIDSDQKQLKISPSLQRTLEEIYQDVNENDNYNRMESEIFTQPSNKTTNQTYKNVKSNRGDNSLKKNYQKQAIQNRYNKQYYGRVSPRYSQNNYLFEHSPSTSILETTTQRQNNAFVNPQKVPLQRLRNDPLTTTQFMTNYIDPPIVKHEVDVPVKLSVRKINSGLDKSLENDTQNEINNCDKWIEALNKKTNEILKQSAHAVDDIKNQCPKGVGATINNQKEVYRLSDIDKNSNVPTKLKSYGTMLPQNRNVQGSKHVNYFENVHSLNQKSASASSQYDYKLPKTLSEYEQGIEKEIQATNFINYPNKPILHRNVTYKRSSPIDTNEDISRDDVRKYREVTFPPEQRSFYGYLKQPPQQIAAAKLRRHLLDLQNQPRSRRYNEPFNVRSLSPHGLRNTYKDYNYNT